VLSGYDTGLFGEIGLQAFYFAQVTNGQSASTFGGVVFKSLLRGRFDDLERYVAHFVRAIETAAAPTTCSRCAGNRTGTTRSHRCASATPSRQHSPAAVPGNPPDGAPGTGVPLPPAKRARAGVQAGYQTTGRRAPSQPSNMAP
jgi:hypothetical protein